jgi:hypothetical protein
VVGPDLEQFLRLLAAINGQWTTSDQPATFVVLCRIPQTAAKSDQIVGSGTAMATEAVGIGEGQCVWMSRLSEDFGGGSFLDDLPEVHHNHPVGDHSDHPKVMGCEEIAEATLGLQLSQQRQNLTLNRHVQR